MEGALQTGFPSPKASQRHPRYGGSPTDLDLVSYLRIPFCTKYGQIDGNSCGKKSEIDPVYINQLYSWKTIGTLKTELTIH